MDPQDSVQELKIWGTRFSVAVILKIKFTYTVALFIPFAWRGDMHDKEECIYFRFIYGCNTARITMFPNSGIEVRGKKTAKFRLRTVEADILRI